MNTSNYVTFVLLRPGNAKYGFSGYTNEMGEHCFVSDRDDRDGNPQPRYFSWSRNKRQMAVREGQKDRFGTDVVEFLRNHPECRGSKLNKEGNYMAWFAEVSEERDAEIILNSKKVKNEASNRAFNLTGDDLYEAAVYLFGTSRGEVLDQHHVVEFAERNPVEFLEKLDSPDFKLKSLLREGIQAKVLSKFGNLIKWEDTVVGADENDAVTKLTKDNDLREAIQRAIDATRIKKPIARPKVLNESDNDPTDPTSDE